MARRMRRIFPRYPMSRWSMQWAANWTHHDSRAPFRSLAPNVFYSAGIFRQRHVSHRVSGKVGGRSLAAPRNASMSSRVSRIATSPAGVCSGGRRSLAANEYLKAARPDDKGKICAIQTGSSFPNLGIRCLTCIEQGTESDPAVRSVPQSG